MLHRMILVALGANLPGPDGRAPLETLDWAVERLRRLPGLALQARSHWYRSAPQPPSSQPDYVNGAARLWGRGTPEGLLDALQGIEDAGGRRRSVANAARTLDLDLLAVDGMVVSTARLVLPHPRLERRAFVLAPLAEIAPDWVHPTLRRSSRELLEGVSAAGVTRLPWGR